MICEDIGATDLNIAFYNSTYMYLYILYLYLHVCSRFCMSLVAENRVALQNADIVKHILMFLAEQKYQELHVFAVMLLASCVEDANIVKVSVFSTVLIIVIVISA